MKSQFAFVTGMFVVPLSLGVIGVALASSVATPTTFVGGTPALASEVNGNFAAHEGAINDNDARITALSEDLNVLAVAHIDGFDTPTVSRSANRVNDEVTTVRRQFGSATGIYIVDFGFDVSDRFLFASAGGQSLGDSVGAAFLSISPSSSFGQVRIEAKVPAGLVDTRFYISVQ